MEDWCIYQAGTTCDHSCEHCHYGLDYELSGNNYIEEPSDDYSDEELLDKEDSN